MRSLLIFLSTQEKVKKESDWLPLATPLLFCLPWLLHEALSVAIYNDSAVSDTIITLIIYGHIITCYNLSSLFSRGVELATLHTRTTK